MSDPLAELARLIGQSDPFADLKGQGTRTPSSLRASDRPAPQWLARPAAPAEDDHYADDPHAAPHDDYADQHPHDDYGYAPQDQHAEHYDDAASAQPAYNGARHQPVGEAYDVGGGGSQYRVALPAAEEYDEDSYYAEDGHMPPHEESATGSRKRGGLITIAAVLGLAVIGTAGAFGYRAFTSGSISSGTPPVIKADTTPAKTVPPAAPTANADAQGKPFQDRVAALATPERVVPREEQPVSLPVAAAPTLPPPAKQAPAPVVAPPPAPSASAANPNEPKRVRTMSIRPDATADAAPIQAPPSSTGATRSIAPPAAKQAAPAGPMAINPQSEPSSRTKVAARTPPAQAAGGAYVVQVSAQRTEAEAQSSYQALQSKYPSVLGSRTANIRRVDLGDKGGVYYRAQVGSFATSDAATAFCNDLKNAGGQCIVQKN